MKNWLNKTEYPFKSNFLKTKYGRLHYIDEGKGDVILFIHGTPTWSFLYRKYIKKLSPNYRCVALDNLGFGLSDKPKDFIGTPQAHNEILTSVIYHLSLENINLVVHDFGGPIGLSYAINNSANIKSITLFNTWLWETKSNKDALKINKILHSWLGDYLYLNTNFSPNILFKRAFYNTKSLSKNTHLHYIKPFTSKKDRYGLLNIGKSLIGSSNWYEENWVKIQCLENIPILILWGDKDEFIKLDQLEKWISKFPNAKVVNFESGHFVQEEKPKESLLALHQFLEIFN